MKEKLLSVLEKGKIRCPWSEDRKEAIEIKFLCVQTIFDLTDDSTRSTHVPNPIQLDHCRLLFPLLDLQTFSLSTADIGTLGK